jgi:tRNA-modifying protein YgfZ
MNALDRIQHEYEALRTEVAVLARPDARPLSIRGEDRADFLHRMTTNDVKSLRQGQSAVTVLTSPTAHIRFVFTVLCRDHDLLLLPAPGQSQPLEQHLRSQIFFMDQVNIEPVTYARWRVMGPRAAEALEGVGWPTGTAENGAWRETDEALFVQQDEYDVPGFEVASPTDAGNLLVATLEKNGATILTGETAYTARRVELGHPAPGYELTEQYNPLEAGLGWACADDKGCYTGQEIIARQLTYDKVTKTLVGLTCDTAVSAGDNVSVEEKVAGQVTSAAYSPGFGQHLALAILRRPHNTPGAQVSVRAVQAQVVELPFL